MKTRLILISILVFVLVACGGKETPTTATEKSVPSPKQNHPNTLSVPTGDLLTWPTDKKIELRLEDGSVVRLDVEILENGAVKLQEVPLPLHAGEAIRIVKDGNVLEFGTIEVVGINSIDVFLYDKWINLGTPQP